MPNPRRVPIGAQLSFDPTQKRPAKGIEAELDSLPRFMGGEGLAGFLPEWVSAKPDLMTRVMQQGPRVLEMDIKPVEPGK